jgi:hypothetical protein
MEVLTDWHARGSVLKLQGSVIVFQPLGTNYQLHLMSEEPYTGPLETPVRGLIRAVARKIYTVPSGGNFIAPIFGPPRIVQGRVLQADERAIVVQAGAPIIIDLPAADIAIDLSEGQIRINHIINAALLAGARFELAAVPQAVS